MYNDIVNDVLSNLKKVTYIIELGIIDGRSKNMREKAFTGITNAELLYIHENGSANGIPKRPVLKIALLDAKKTFIPQFWDSIKDITNQQEIEHQLDVLCNQIENHAKNMIYHRDKRLAANSPRTIAHKKSDLPLLDTGKMVRSIKCRWYKL